MYEFFLKSKIIADINISINENFTSPEKRKMKQQKTSNDSLVFFDTGFHGDKYLITLVHTLLRYCDCFIETGTNVGSTLAYTASQHPEILCLSCEPYETALKHAQKNTRGLSNIILFNRTSEEFLKEIYRNWSHLFHNKVMFWLDAHGRGYNWPLLGEIDFITSNFKNAYVIIDDFKVPGLECFGYEKYNNQECSYAFIKEKINFDKYWIYYPNYTERTSNHHPLRGWGMITRIKKGLEVLPSSLTGKIKIILY